MTEPMQRDPTDRERRIVESYEPSKKRCAPCSCGRGDQLVSEGRCAACQYEREHPMADSRSLADAPRAPRVKLGQTETLPGMEGA